MARFFALDFLNQKESRLGAIGCLTLLGATLLLPPTLQAQSTTTMMQAAPPTGGASPTNAAPAAPKGNAPAAANPAKPPTPPPPPQAQDTFNRYGKIWAPSDDLAHPIKLNMQFPVGELKVPNQDELKQRDKLEDLAKLSDEDIRAKLAEWPPYAKMKLADEGQLLIRIQQFKEQRTKVAMDRARELGLINSLTPEQKVKFEQEYWDKKLQMDHELAKQFEPVFKARDQKLRDDLFKEFSTAGTVVPAPPAPAPKPPAPPVAQNKPGATTNAPGATPPVAQNKPGATTNAPGATPPPAVGTPSTAKPPAVPIAQGKPEPGAAAPVVH